MMWGQYGVHGQIVDEPRSTRPYYNTLINVGTWFGGGRFLVWVPYLSTFLDLPDWKVPTSGTQIPSISHKFSAFNDCMLICVKGAGGPWPSDGQKWVYMYYICDEGHGGLPDAFYQLKNIVPSLSYRDFKFGFHIQLHCSRALEKRLYLKIKNFEL